MEKTTRVIDDTLRLVPYYEQYDVTLPWYQDRQLCLQVDGREEPYTRERLAQMYTFLDTHGLCWYIEYEGKLAGDITLRDNGEICIVISPEYQNRHLGRRSVMEVLKVAAEQGLDHVTAEIYAFNAQSRRMFMACGFAETEPEQFIRRVSLADEDMVPRE